MWKRHNAKYQNYTRQPTSCCFVPSEAWRVNRHYVSLYGKEHLLCLTECKKGCDWLIQSKLSIQHTLPKCLCMYRFFWMLPAHLFRLDPGRHPGIFFRGAARVVVGYGVPLEVWHQLHHHPLQLSGHRAHHMLLPHTLTVHTDLPVETGQQSGAEWPQPKQPTQTETMQNSSWLRICKKLIKFCETDNQANKMIYSLLNGSS